MAKEIKLPMRQIFEGMSNKARSDANARDCINKLVVHLSSGNRSKDIIWTTAAQDLYQRAGGDMYPPHGIGAVFSRMFSRNNRLVGVELDGVKTDPQKGTGTAQFYLPTLQISGTAPVMDKGKLESYSSTSISGLDPWLKEVVTGGNSVELEHLSQSLRPAYEAANALGRLRKLASGLNP